MNLFERLAKGRRFPKNAENIHFNDLDPELDTHEGIDQLNAAIKAKIKELNKQQKPSKYDKSLIDNLAYDWRRDVAYGEPILENRQTKQIVDDKIKDLKYYGGNSIPAQNAYNVSWKMGDDTIVEPVMAPNEDVARKKAKRLHNMVPHLAKNYTVEPFIGPLPRDYVKTLSDQDIVTRAALTGAAEQMSSPNWGLHSDLNRFWEQPTYKWAARDYCNKVNGVEQLLREANMSDDDIMMNALDLIENPELVNPATRERALVFINGED